MFSKQFALALLVAYAEARFGQENVPIPAISAIQGGDPGAAATIAGATVSDLLGAANACAKIARADQIVTELGGGQDAIEAAKGLIAAEKNTNPFGANTQFVCGDATLPVTPELRGITTKIDPENVDTQGLSTALAEQTLTTPLDATGKSIFDLMSENGLGDLIASQDADGNAAAGGNGAAAGGNGAAAGGNDAATGGNATAGGDAATGGAADDATADLTGNGNANAGNQNAGNQNGQQATQNNGQQAAQNNNGQQAAQDNNNANAGNNNNANAGNNNNANAGNNNNANAGNNNANAGNQNAGNDANAGAGAGGAAAGGAADFGQCDPTIFREGGLNGRPATEFTFQITDPLARGGQQEALNPNIITNALCNQLTNVCGANAAAVDLCEQGKAAVEAAGTRDDTTVTLFNGFVQGGGAARLVRSAKFRI